MLLSAFLWLLAVVCCVVVSAVDSGAVVSPSSAEASRLSAWMTWSWSISGLASGLALLLLVGLVAVRLRFPAA